MIELKTIHPEFLVFGREQMLAVLPYLLVFGGTVLTIIASVMRMIQPKWPVFILTLGTAAAGIWASQGLFGTESRTLFNGMLAVDSFAGFFNMVFLASAALTALASFRYLDRERLQHPEYYVLLLFSALGMMLMGSALDLIVVFIALELMSLSVYVLVGFRRADRRSNEAAMKYFILGSAASAVLLYGTALLYGATGTTAIRGISAFAQGTQPGTNMGLVYVLGVCLVVLGFLFKIAAVPFHMWMPDVYEGAPSPITGFMTTGLKAASFAAFLRVFMSLGYGKGMTLSVQTHFHHILWVSAVLTMLIGNVIALTQTNLKRMLAYSSIAHSGYLLIGLLSGASSENGYSAVVTYLVVYSVMNLGAFAILTLLSSREDSALNLHDLSGLAKRHPWLSLAMGIFMFSMAGVPPTAGFTAKYLLFYSAVQAGEVPLVIIGVLCSAISVYYYLRVLVYMYMRDPIGAPSAVASRSSVWAAAVVGAMAILTVQVGILPGKLVMAAKKAVTGF